MELASIVNLTPHALHIHDVNGGVFTLPASGQVARCEERSEHVGTVHVETVGAEGGDIEGNAFALTRTVLGDVVGLPDEQPGVLYVVSVLVRQAVPHRRDVVSPGSLVRDDAGRPIGCRGLSVN